MWLLFAVFFFQSCKKTNKSPTVNCNGSMSAKVDGSSWQALCAGAVDSVGIMGIGDSTNDKSKILIYFPDSVAAVSTFSIGGNSGSALDYLNSGTNSEYSADPLLGGSGSVTITRYDKSARRIEGTFSGTLNNINGTSGSSKIITNGVFAVNY
jgi:hypothetical protein